MRYLVGVCNHMSGGTSHLNFPDRVFASKNQSWQPVQFRHRKPGNGCATKLAACTGRQHRQSAPKETWQASSRTPALNRQVRRANRVLAVSHSSGSPDFHEVLDIRDACQLLAPLLDIVYVRAGLAFHGCITSSNLCCPRQVHHMRVHTELCP